MYNFDDNKYLWQGPHVSIMITFLALMFKDFSFFILIRHMYFQRLYSTHYDFQDESA